MRIIADIISDFMEPIAYLPFGLCVSTIYILIRTKLIKQREARHELFTFLFVMYLVVVAILTIFSREDIAQPPELIPLTENTSIAHIFENVCMFVPFGMFITLKKSKAWGVAIYGALVSLFIEIVQLITARGRFETSDLIANTAGVLIGWAVIKLLCKKKGKNQCTESTTNESKT